MEPLRTLSQPIDVLAHLPNTEVVDIQPSDNFRPQVNQKCIALVHAHFVDWSPSETLALLPHLHYLRFTVHNLCAIKTLI